ncbi:MAG: multicopper oxidase domain-containing protein, partial [Verrucomicrobiota bacterium]
MSPGNIYALSLAAILTLSSDSLYSQSSDGESSSERRPKGDRVARGEKGERPGKGERKPKGGKGGGKRFFDRFESEYPVVYHDLHIPPLLEGKDIDLTLDESHKVFWAPTKSKTFGYNGSDFWGPTVVLNQGDFVNLRVHNRLDEETTVHWHGFELPPTEDGGPHQIIRPGDSLTSSFKVLNKAATYWYHPHPHEATQDQMTYGAGGLILVRDPIESKLSLPRTYGVDDIPIVFTSRRFYDNDQFSLEGDDDKYGDYLLTNGDFHAQVDLPAQWVRLRVLNAEIERGHILGFSDDRTYYQIATDGGLVDKPVPLKRMILSVGERVELLLDLRNEEPGTSFNLMAFNSGQEFGFPGSEPGKGGTNGSLLNNMDFPILKINVAPRTDNPVLSVPTVLTENQFWAESEVDERREFTIYKKRGGTTFQFDRVEYDMDLVNH